MSNGLFEFKVFVFLNMQNMSVFERGAAYYYVFNMRATREILKLIGNFLKLPNHFWVIVNVKIQKGSASI